MSSELLENTPQDDSQNSETQPMESIESESQNSHNTWGRLIPVCTNHTESTLNQVFELSSSIITIGRDESNDINLKCPMLSSKHCKLICNNDNNIITIFIEDTSTNGTWIDKKKISKTKVLINDGCEIILVPPSKKRKRKKLSYFFHLESSQRRHNNNTNIPTLESKYFIIRDLGSGAFSTVKLVQSRSSNDKYALKIIDRHSWQRMKHATNRDVSLLDEVEIMKKANHKNIVKVYEYFEEDTKVNVILDFCGGGDMLEYIQKYGSYKNNKARNLFKQLIDSVNYLHSLKIAHRDLKPDNILLTDTNGDQLKISDFGISREQSSSGCGTIIGTPLYQAPEVHTGKGYDGTLADYWSLGIILYVMLVAAPPISPNETSSKICEMSEKKTLPWYDEPICETAKDLIYKLLSIDPKERITADNIYKHAWMNGYDNFNENNKNNKCDNKCQFGNSDTNDSKEEEEQLITGIINNNINSNNNNNLFIKNKKRKANFDDDNNDGFEINKPPNKKQKSDPNGIQKKDIIPIDLMKSNNTNDNI